MRTLSLLERRFEAVASNLANSSTPGHKRLVASSTFAEHLARAGRGQGQSADLVLTRDYAQGDTIETGNPFDLALDGPGFFAVEKEGDTAYARLVQLYLDQNSFLVDQRGHRLLGETGPIQVSGSLGEVRVLTDGTVRSGTQDVGQLRVVDFADPLALRDGGSGYFRADSTASVTASTAVVRSGHVEASNVDSLTEMVSMITLQRQFQAAQRALRTQSDIRDRLVQSLR
jgi:flagellar basal body rod protein FlgG